MRESREKRDMGEERDKVGEGEGQERRRGKECIVHRHVLVAVPNRTSFLSKVQYPLRTGVT